VSDRIGSRALNRATLARQLLLERTDRTPLDVIRHLVGLQAQDPELPYLGLRARITGFAIADLEALLERREVVRATLHRATQHLLAADDYRWVRPALGPMLARTYRGVWAKQLRDVDPAELAAASRDLIGDGVVSRPDLGRALAERWPAVPPVGLARSAQALLPVVHPYPDGTWGRRGPTPFALAGAHLGTGPDPGPPLARLERLVLRYLAAFGPASVRDVQAWSGLTRLREVVEGLRPRLRGLTDDTGRELVDLPDAPRPPADLPAPLRFLPLLDNTVLAWADRSRIVPDELRTPLVVEAAVLVDGTVAGLWRIRRADGAAVLEVDLARPLSRADLAALEAEGAGLLRFAAADATGHDLRIRAPE
jgi:hypothetical protein